MSTNRSGGVSTQQTDQSQQQLAQQFNSSLNKYWNEQFHQDYNKQQKLLQSNPRFLRTRQSLEASRRFPTQVVADLAPYPLYQENTLRPTTIRKQLFGNQVECNILNQIFLSPENINHLQEKIRFAIFSASNSQHVIGRQSERELVIIMRSIYFTYARNLAGPPDVIKKQIVDLNDLVVQECVSKILSEIQGHIRYLFDASTVNFPEDRPVNVNNTGLKQLPSVTSIFFT